MEEEKTPTVETEKVETNTEEPKKEEKTFTQEDFDKALQNAIKLKTKGIPSKEELKAYNEWKESQKTQQDKYDELVKKDGEKDTTISNLQKENEILKSGVTDSDDVEFILYKVGKMEGDFSENLKQYLADNPKYTKKQETKATGVEQNHSTPTKETGVMAILKARHPEQFK